MRINILPIKALAIAALVVFAVGCSELNAPTASSPPETSSENFQYPPIDNVIATVENAGYKVVSPRAESALDDQDCDTIRSDRYARVNQAGSLNLQSIVRLEWTQNVLPSNMTLSIVAPSECLGVADFYPHPTFFNGTVNIVWDVSIMDLPDDFNFDNLVPLYVHDDGTIEEVQYSWRGNHQQLVVVTNHFSRYIITQRLAG